MVHIQALPSAIASYHLLAALCLTWKEFRGVTLSGQLSTSQKCHHNNKHVCWLSAKRPSDEQPLGLNYLFVTGNGDLPKIKELLSLMWMRRLLKLREIWIKSKLQNSSLDSVIRSLVSYFHYIEITFKPCSLFLFFGFFFLPDMITIIYFKVEIILIAIYSFP